MSLGTDCGTILALLLNKIQCLLDTLFGLIFWIGIVPDGSKLLVKDVAFVSPFSVLFCDLCPHSCTFYVSKTHKCQKPLFHFFVKNQKECIHTCTFYVSKTHKCAVTIFIISTKTKQRRKPSISNAPRLDFGSTFAQFGSLLQPFEF